MLVYSLNSENGDENLWLCSLKSLEELITQSTLSNIQTTKSNDNLIEYLEEILQKLFKLSKCETNIVIIESKNFILFYFAD